MIVEPQTKTDTRDDARWKPLRVWCRTETAVGTYGDGLALDGILAFGAYQAWLEGQRELPEDDRTELPPLNHTDWPIDFDLPVATWAMPLVTGEPVDERLLTADGQVWGWCCSHVSASWLGRERIKVRSKPPVTEAMRYSDAHRVNTSSGRFKGIDLAYEGRYAERLVWYALGDPDAVADLLRRVPGVGKRVATGHGVIERTLRGVPDWHIDIIEEDYSVRGPDGEWMRAVPYTGDGVGRIHSVRAPNHHRSRHILCHAPLDV